MLITQSISHAQEAIGLISSLQASLPPSKQAEQMVNIHKAQAGLHSLCMSLAKPQNLSSSASAKKTFSDTMKKYKLFFQDKLQKSANEKMNLFFSYVFREIENFLSSFQDNSGKKTRDPSFSRSRDKENNCAQKPKAKITKEQVEYLASKLERSIYETRSKSRPHQSPQLRMSNFSILSKPRKVELSDILHTLPEGERIIPYDSFFDAKKYLDKEIKCRQNSRLQSSLPLSRYKKEHELEDFEILCLFSDPPRLRIARNFSQAFRKKRVFKKMTDKFLFQNFKTEKYLEIDEVLNWTLASHSKKTSRLSLCRPSQILTNQKAPVRRRFSENYSYNQEIVFSEISLTPNPDLHFKKGHSVSKNLDQFFSSDIPKIEKGLSRHQVNTCYNLQQKKGLESEDLLSKHPLVRDIYLTYSYGSIVHLIKEEKKMSSFSICDLRYEPIIKRRESIRNFSSFLQVNQQKFPREFSLAYHSMLTLMKQPLKFDISSAQRGIRRDSIRMRDFDLSNCYTSSQFKKEKEIVFSSVMNLTFEKFVRELSISSYESLSHIKKAKDFEFGDFNIAKIQKSCPILNQESFLGYFKPKTGSNFEIQNSIFVLQKSVQVVPEPPIEIEAFDLKKSSKDFDLQEGFTLVWKKKEKKPTEHLCSLNYSLNLSGFRGSELLSEACFGNVEKKGTSLSYSRNFSLTISAVPRPKLSIDENHAFAKPEEMVQSQRASLNFSRNYSFRVPMSRRKSFSQENFVVFRFANEHDESIDETLPLSEEKNLKSSVHLEKTPTSHVANPPIELSIQEFSVVQQAKRSKTFEVFSNYELSKCSNNIKTLLSSKVIQIFTSTVKVPSVVPSPLKRSEKLSSAEKNLNFLTVKIFESARKEVSRNLISNFVFSQAQELQKKNLLLTNLPIFSNIRISSARLIDDVFLIHILSFKMSTPELQMASFNILEWVKNDPESGRVFPESGRVNTITSQSNHSRKEQSENNERKAMSLRLERSSEFTYPKKGDYLIRKGKRMEVEKIPSVILQSMKMERWHEISETVSLASFPSSPEPEILEPSQKSVPELLRIVAKLKMKYNQLQSVSSLMKLSHEKVVSDLNRRVEKLKSEKEKVETLRNLLDKTAIEKQLLEKHQTLVKAPEQYQTYIYQIEQALSDAQVENSVLSKEILLSEYKVENLELRVSNVSKKSDLMWSIIRLLVKECLNSDILDSIPTVVNIESLQRIRSRIEENVQREIEGSTSILVLSRGESVAGERTVVNWVRSKALLIEEKELEIEERLKSLDQEDRMRDYSSERAQLAQAVSRLLAVRKGRLAVELPTIVNVIGALLGIDEPLKQLDVEGFIRQFETS